MNIESIEYWMGVCVRAMARMGVTQETHLNHAYESRSEKFRAWCIESVFSGLRALRENDPVLALRCALQAADYVGRNDGEWPAHIGDAFTCLRNELELVAASAIRKVA